MIKLPAPQHQGSVSVEKALTERRSVRSYREDPLTIPEISQLLWACQGITEPKRGLRTAPSARAAYLLEVYLLSGNVANLQKGMYRYEPNGHGLEKVADGDIKGELFKAVGQAPIKNAPAVLVFFGKSERTTTQRWIFLEAGHAAQNVYLQGISLGIGGVVMAGFMDESVRKALNMPENRQPVYIMPIGRVK
jgi:SagB-type dehydrogenase family enzyme